jgi:hypothetical protein
MRRTGLKTGINHELCDVLNRVATHEPLYVARGPRGPSLGTLNASLFYEGLLVAHVSLGSPCPSLGWALVNILRNSVLQGLSGFGLFCVDS